MGSHSDDENYFYVPRSYNMPVVEPPNPSQLMGDTSYPQLSSTAFYYEIYKNIREPREFLPIYSLIEMSAEGLFVVGTNDYSSSIVEGNFIGTEDFESIVHSNIPKTAFQLPGNSIVTGLRFLEPNKFVTMRMDSGLELYSSKSPKRDELNNSNVFRLSEQHTDGYASNLAKLSKEAKFIVGTSKGHLSVYDYESANLTECSEILYAHSAEITGVSSHPSSTRIWATCSNDRVCLLWDKSQEKKASAILSNYEHRLTALHWSSQEENQELVVLGDEIGNVLTIDPRQPNKILNTSRISDRPIKSLSFNGNKRFGVISKSNVMKIVETSSDSKPLKLVHQEVTRGTIYAMCWDCKHPNTFYIVGDNQFAHKITLS